MRTTLDLPDDLMRSVKVLAAQTDRTLTETVTALLRTGLEAPERPRERVKFPLVHTPRKATAEELSPERVAQILMDGEVEDILGQMR